MEKTLAITSIVVIVAILLCLSLSGCSSILLEHKLFSRFYNTSANEAEAMLEILLATVETGDSESVKKVFSKHIQDSVSNLDNSISALLKFYNGKMISYDRNATGSSATKENRTYKNEIFTSFDVTTTVDTYRIAFIFCTVDNEYPDNVGLTSVYIIRAEDSNMETAYWGIDNENDIWKPGINIE